MSLVEKSVWFIESHFADELSLDGIAAAGSVSRFHLARAFGLATGWPVMRHVRARRLSEAARALSLGAPDIAAVALEAGYGSHEAFTRAFRGQFGMTPEQARALGGMDQLRLVEPLNMSGEADARLEQPRRENGAALLIVGLGQRYTVETTAGIPMRWQRFQPFIETIGRRIGGEAYGVCCDFDESGRFEYVCGVAVSGLDDPPRGLRSVRIAAHAYLVFPHRGHVSGISRTWRAIMDRWLPASGTRMAEAPCFERYGPGFDGATGEGEVEIWIPVESGRPR